MNFLPGILREPAVWALIVLLAVLVPLLERTMRRSKDKGAPLAPVPDVDSPKDEEITSHRIQAEAIEKAGMECLTALKRYLKRKGESSLYIWHLEGVERFHIALDSKNSNEQLFYLTIERGTDPNLTGVLVVERYDGEDGKRVETRALTDGNIYECIEDGREAIDYFMIRPPKPSER